MPSVDTISLVVSTLGLSFSAELANTLIALLALIFSIITFIWQRRLDRESKRQAIESAAKSQLEAEKLRERNIAFQWYKEFAIAPNITHLNNFYKCLYDLHIDLEQEIVSQEDKNAIETKIDDAAADLFNTLISAIRPLDKKLSDDVADQIDELSDHIVSIIFDNEHRLSNKKVFNKYIGENIEQSKHEIFALLYRYGAQVDLKDESH